MIRLVAVMLLVAASISSPLLAQENNAATSGVAAETAKRAIDKKGLGLTPEQETLISDFTKDEKIQASPAQLAIGSPIPDAMMLIEMPVEVKDQIGVLRDFKFARVQDDAVVLVDPTSRVIVDVIQK